jgi:hypothetical protein
MGLGKRKSGSSNFLPLAKFDGRTGSMFLENRVYSEGEWTKQQVDVTTTFQGVFDLPGMWKGWVRFPRSAAPELAMVPVNEEYPEEPPGDDFKEGIRVLVALGPELGGGIRELMSTSIGMWNAMDALYTAYEAAAPQHPGQLPLVKLVDVIEVRNAAGTSFEPKFEIIAWVPRPVELVVGRPPAPAAPTKSANGLTDDDVPF